MMMQVHTCRFEPERLPMVPYWRKWMVWKWLCQRERVWRLEQGLVWQKGEMAWLRVWMREW